MNFLKINQITKQNFSSGKETIVDFFPFYSQQKFDSELNLMQVCL